MEAIADMDMRHANEHARASAAYSYTIVPCTASTLMRCHNPTPLRLPLVRLEFPIDEVNGAVGNKIKPLACQLLIATKVNSVALTVTT